jgi:hypothetical protein
MQKIQRAVGFPELTHAPKMSLQSAGKTDATKLFSEALGTTPMGPLNARKGGLLMLKMCWYCIHPKKHCICLLKIICQNKKFKVQQK